MASAATTPQTVMAPPSARAPALTPAAPEESAPMAFAPGSIGPETTAPAAPVAPSVVIAEEVVREQRPAAEFTLPATSVDAAPALKFEWPSDLVQIETNAEKLKAAVANAQQEQPAPRQKRERPHLPPVSDEPLIQVETQKSVPAVEPAAPVKSAGEEPASAPN